MKEQDQLNTSTVGQQKVELCWNCFNFKTMVVHLHNITDVRMLQEKEIVQKRIYEYGQTKVWFCRKTGKVITKKQWAMMVTDANCTCREVDDDT